MVRPGWRFAFCPTPLVALPWASQSTSSTLRPSRASDGGQIDGRGGLSDSALLVCDGDNLGHIRCLPYNSVD